MNAAIDLEGKRTVKKLITSAALTIGLFTTSVAASAGERTITLAVENMVCAVCAFNVKKSLEGVAGVATVRVSLKEKTAIVVYDDTKADLNALISATTSKGFPSAPKS